MSELSNRSSRPLVRSHFGCSMCKARKLKCDEARPVCGPCKKSTRTCHYLDKAVFRNFDRRGQAETTSKDIIAFNGREVWLDIPKEITFVSPSPSCEPVPLVPSSSISPSAIIPDNEGHTSPSQLSHGSLVDNAYSPTSTLAHDTPFESHGRERERGSENENVLSLSLIRHYREGAGQWLDAFDTGAYFSRKAPIKAVSSPLIKASICALAAKHLLRTGRATNSTGGQFSIASALDNGDINWDWRCAEYYDEAIRHLQDAIGNYSIDLEVPGNAAEQECIFAAVTILSMYELMDTPGTSWQAHLAVLPLFNTSPPDNLGSLSSSQHRTFVHRPIFWGLVRQDFLCSFISETQTRLKLNDARLWENAGLAGDSRGVRLPLSPSGSVNADSSADDAEEDKKSNELTWLLCKIMNHLTSGDALWPEDYARPKGQRCPVGVPQDQLLDRWYVLMGDLDNWFAGLSPSFSPSTRTNFSHYDNSDGSPFSDFEQIWYELPQCAATMQWYYMARILLLVNRPQESTAIRSTVSARLRCYRETMQAVLQHSRDICAISLANPTEPVRIHSVQPLFVAGQVFHLEQERRAVLSLLSGIEKDLGWSTTYHRARLRHEWDMEGGLFADDASARQ